MRSVSITIFSSVNNVEKDTLLILKVNNVTTNVQSHITKIYHPSHVGDVNSNSVWSVIVLSVCSVNQINF